MITSKHLLSLKDFQTVLVEYLRKKDKFVPYIKETEMGLVPEIAYMKGQIYGIVVSIGPGLIGWALCDRKDTFSKEYGIHLALQRARIATSLSLRERRRFYSKIPTSLGELFDKMDDRSEKYFKIDDDSSDE